MPQVSAVRPGSVGSGAQLDVPVQLTSKTRPLIRASLEAFSAGCGRKCRRHHQQRNEEVGAGVASRPRVGHGRPLTGPECGPLAPVPCCPPDSRPGVSRPAICTRRKVRSDSPGMTSVQSTFTAILAATYESSIYVWQVRDASRTKPSRHASYPCGCRVPNDGCRPLRTYTEDQRRATMPGWLQSVELTACFPSFSVSKDTKSLNDLFLDSNCHFTLT
jgi:hypothetical protein